LWIEVEEDGAIFITLETIFPPSTEHGGKPGTFYFTQNGSCGAFKIN
jgi:hypothetical protein